MLEIKHGGQCRANQFCVNREVSENTGVVLSGKFMPVKPWHLFGADVAVQVAPLGTRFLAHRRRGLVFMKKK